MEFESVLRLAILFLGLGVVLALCFNGDEQIRLGATRHPDDRL